MILRYRGNFYESDNRHIEKVETITAKYRGVSYEIQSLPLKASSQETLNLKYRGVGYKVRSHQPSRSESRHLSPQASLLI